MTRRSIDSASPGEVLAEDACDRHGRRLLAEGTALTRRDLDSLKMWGVRTLELESPTPEAEQGVPRIQPWAEKEARSAVDEHFAHTPAGNPLVRALKKRALRRLARKIQTEAALEQ